MTGARPAGGVDEIRGWGRIGRSCDADAALDVSRCVASGFCSPPWPSTTRRWPPTAAVAPAHASAARPALWRVLRGIYGAVERLRQAGPTRCPHVSNARREVRRAPGVVHGTRAATSPRGCISPHAERPLTAALACPLCDPSGPLRVARRHRPCAGAPPGPRHPSPSQARRARRRPRRRRRPRTRPETEAAPPRRRGLPAPARRARSVATRRPHRPPGVYTTPSPARAISDPPRCSRADCGATAHTCRTRTRNANAHASSSRRRPSLGSAVRRGGGDAHRGRIRFVLAAPAPLRARVQARRQAVRRTRGPRPRTAWWPGRGRGIRIGTRGGGGGLAVEAPQRRADTRAATPWHACEDDDAGRERGQARRGSAALGDGLMGRVPLCHGRARVGARGDASEGAAAARRPARASRAPPTLRGRSVRARGVAIGGGTCETGRV